MILVRYRAQYRPVPVERLGLTAPQMRALGELGIAEIRDRASRGLGINDAPMKPLNRFYARKKQRSGLPAIRNMRGPGLGPHMLDEISVRRAESNLVRIDIPTRLARIKAAANEKKSPWYGWSPRNAAVILEAAQEMARGNIREVTAERGLPIWMDPYRRRSIGQSTRIKGV